MVTLQFIKSLPAPSAFELLSVLEIETERRDGLKSDLPEWDETQVDDLLYKSNTNSSLREYALRERSNQNYTASFMPFAKNEDLDLILIAFGILRNPNESDDDVMLRAVHSWDALAPSTLAGIKALPLNYFTKFIVDDVSPVLGANKQDNTIYALKPGAVALTNNERALLQTYMNQDDTVVWGNSITVGVTRAVSYTVGATITYDSQEYDSAVLEDLIRSSVYQFIDDTTKLNSPINVPMLQGSMKLPGVINAVATAPARNLASAADLVYKCNKDTTDVVFTMTAA